MEGTRCEQCGHVIVGGYGHERSCEKYHRRFVNLNPGIETARLYNKAKSELDADPKKHIALLQEDYREAVQCNHELNAQIKELQRELAAAQSDAKRWEDASNANRDAAMGYQDRALNSERELAAAVEAKASSDAAYARLMDTAAKYRDERDAAVERAEKAESEIAAAMKVLDPAMPESGLEDACRQVKQAAITHAENSDRLAVLWRQAEAERDALILEFSQYREATQKITSGSMFILERERDSLRAKLELMEKHTPLEYRVANDEILTLRAEVERLKEALDRGVMALRGMAALSHFREHFPGITSRLDEVAAYMICRKEGK